MPWLSVTGICMQSCSQSTEISVIECKLVIAAFFLNQLREVKHQTEKYCKFKTKTYCVLQTVPNKLCAYSSTFFDQFLDASQFFYMIQCCCQIVLSKLKSAYKWNLFLLSFSFPHLITFIASLRMSAQCLRKYFWVWLEKF